MATYVRAARECYICREEKQRTGDSAMQTEFKKLTQHLRAKHGMTHIQARAAASAQKMPATKKSKDGRNYYMCKECKVLVAKKGPHLTSKDHGMQQNTGPYQTAMREMFLPARTAMPPYGTQAVGIVGDAVPYHHDVPDINFSDSEEDMDVTEASRMPARSLGLDAAETTPGLIVDPFNEEDDISSQGTFEYQEHRESVQKRKERVPVPPGVKAQIKDTFLEVIFHYVEEPTKVVPIHIIKEMRKDMWPQYTDKQLVDIIRNIVKKMKKT